MGQSFTALTYSKTRGEWSSLCLCNSFVFGTVRVQLTSAKHQNPFPVGGSCCSTGKGQQTLLRPVLLPGRYKQRHGQLGVAGTACAVRSKVLQLQLSLSPRCKSEGRSAQEGNTAEKGRPKPFWKAKLILIKHLSVSNFFQSPF